MLLRFCVCLLRSIIELMDIRCNGSKYLIIEKWCILCGCLECCVDMCWFERFVVEVNCRRGVCCKIMYMI